MYKFGVYDYFYFIKVIEKGSGGDGGGGGGYLLIFFSLNYIEIIYFF